MSAPLAYVASVGSVTAPELPGTGLSARAALSAVPSPPGTKFPLIPPAARTSPPDSARAGCSSGVPPPHPVAASATPADASATKLLAEAGREIVRARLLLELLILRMELHGAFEQEL